MRAGRRLTNRSFARRERPVEIETDAKLPHASRCRILAGAGRAKRWTVDTPETSISMAAPEA